MGHHSSHSIPQQIDHFTDVVISPTKFGCLGPFHLWEVSLDTNFEHIFPSIFNPTSLHIPYPTLSPSCLSRLCLFLLYLYAFTLTNKRQEHNLIGPTGYQTTRLLGYRHSETVLLWFPFTRILHRNLFCCHRTLPPLKVPDFPNSEHE